MTRAFVLHSDTPDEQGGGDQASRLRELVGSLEKGEANAVHPDDRTDQHTAPERKIPVIAIASGKGGVGKTTTSVNLSIALSAMNRRTVLMDADIGLANADVLCGLMPKNRLESAANQDGFTLEDLAIDAPGGFRLIPGSVGIGRVDELNDEERRTLLSSLRTMHRHNDVVLIDTSAGLGPSVTEFVAAADLGLMVVTPEPTSIADAYALIKVLVSGEGDARPPVLSLIINQVANEREAEQVHDRIAGVCDRFLGYQIPMLGYIRRDKKVLSAVRSRVPYMIDAPKSHAGKDMTRLAQTLVEWAGIEGRAAATSSRRGWFARR